MRSKAVLALLAASFLFGIASARAQFKLTRTEPEQGTPVTVDVDFTGTLPAQPAPYLEPANWTVLWRADASSVPHVATVQTIEASAPTQKLRLHLAGTLPAEDLERRSYWTVLFRPINSPDLLPQIFSSTPGGHLAPASSGKKSCDNSSPGSQPFFCPPGAGQPADISVSGTFLAAGGSKPIYSFQFKGGLVANHTLVGFSPGVAADVEINQSTQPPNNRTSFDPDSITAGLSFSRVVPIQKGSLYGVRLQAALPSGEFSRSDPSSNIIVAPAASFALRAWQPAAAPSLYATFYPLLGVEAGRNLNKPRELAGTAVDLSSYNTVVRGLLGADAQLAVATDDRTANVFSIAASYRVRIPAFDEPLVRTSHQVTSVEVTTRARHWVEADVNYAPWKFKYLSLTAKYQYGELPPLFNLVNHSFTLGLTLQAVQSGKPSLAPAFH